MHIKITKRVCQSLIATNLRNIQFIFRSTSHHKHLEHRPHRCVNLYIILTRVSDTTTNFSLRFSPTFSEKYATRKNLELPAFKFKDLEHEERETIQPQTHSTSNFCDDFHTKLYLTCAKQPIKYITFRHQSIFFNFSLVKFPT